MRAAALGCWRRRVAGEERAQGASGRAASGQAPVCRMSGPPRAYTVARAPCVSQKCAQSGDKFSKISHFLTNLCEICGRRREICPSKFEGERGKMLARAKLRVGYGGCCHVGQGRVVGQGCRVNIFFRAPSNCCARMCVVASRVPRRLDISLQSGLSQQPRGS